MAEELANLLKIRETEELAGFSDSFIHEFFKIFKDIISPLLIQSYHCCLDSGPLFPSWRDATIVYIHKEVKDPTECQSYRPILLLNYLAQIIRDDSKIKGIVIREEEHKPSLYADDVLLYLSDPTTTVPHLKKIIDQFGF